MLKQNKPEVWKMPRLVQRLVKAHVSKTPNPYSFGGGLHYGGIPPETAQQLSGIFWFDYMGAAEYENGAVTQALARMFDAWDEYVSCENGIASGSPVTILARKGQQDSAKSYLRQLFQDRSLFQNDRVIGALDLDNAVAYFLDKDVHDKFVEHMAGLRTGQ